MSYLNKTSNGKYLKDNHKKKSRYRRYYKTLCACFIIGLLVGNLSSWAIVSSAEKYYQKPAENLAELTFVSEPCIHDEVDATEETSSEVEDGFVALEVPMDEAMQEFVYSLSNESDIDFPLVMALINRESSFRENVISDTDDYGLMQINEINHEWLNQTIGVTNFLDPYENIRSGVFILEQLFEKYEDPAMVLMAYNMGETGAGKLWDKGIYSTDYAESILRQADIYSKQIAERME